jgi:hypothetical protein
VTYKECRLLGFDVSEEQIGSNMEQKLRGSESYFGSLTFLYVDHVRTAQETPVDLYGHLRR